MSLPSLYNLTDDFRKLMDCDSDDTTDALIEISAQEIEAKAASYCQVIKIMETQAEAFKAEADRITAAGKAIKNRVTAIKSRMKDALLNAGIDKLTAGTFKVSVSLTAGSLEIDDMEAIPNCFKTVTQSVSVRKDEIKIALKNGQDVPGCHIEAGTQLRIK